MIPLLPKKRLLLSLHRMFFPVALMLVLISLAGAQTGQVTLKGSVSEIVALSVPPNWTNSEIDIDVVSSNTVRITFSSDVSQAAGVRLPLLVRSNGAFRISATVESKTAVLTQLSIIDVRPTGSLVSARAVADLNVPRQFDLRGLDESAGLGSTVVDVSGSFLVANGPRVSLGGTLQSPNNALQMTLLIRVKPEQECLSCVQLTLSGTAEPRIQ